MRRFAEAARRFAESRIRARGAPESWAGLQINKDAQNDASHEFSLADLLLGAASTGQA